MAFFRQCPRNGPTVLRPPKCLALVSFVGLGLAGCSSSPDLGAWRRTEETARPAGLRGDLRADLEGVERLRKALQLEESRKLALSLAAENPEHSAVLYLASRAESDAVFLFPKDERNKRDLAALSALDYGRRALEVTDATVAAMAQYAWAMGTSTHLQPMFHRSEHATKTLEAIDATLRRDPENVTALAAKSILRLRLATLPWIARVMASGAPEGSVEEAIDTARRCVASVPSIENELILARALIESGRAEEARSRLEGAVADPDTYPRDAQLRPEAERLLRSLTEN